MGEGGGGCRCRDETEDESNGRKYAEELLEGSTEKK